MSRYFIELSFKGTAYHGWQRQGNAPTVQSALEETLRILSREPVRTTGAGRTDAGVHARFYVAHFNSEHPLFQSKVDAVYKMNALLPNDISISDLYPVLPDAHARFSALSRTYEYVISQTKDPFDTGLSWYFPTSLDLDAMNLSAGILMHHTDFTSFSKLHGNAKTNVCHIGEAMWLVRNHKIVFRISADRFLRNMVRALVGTMTDVGRGKLGQDDFKRIIEERNRTAAGYSAPAEGLSLVNVDYPQGIRQ